MELTKYRLGDLLDLSEERNDNLLYGLSDLKGISIQKVFIQTKADMTGVSLRPYFLVRPDDFAYVTVTSRNGEKITIAHNDTDKTYIVSSSYLVFRVVKPNILDSDYLFMYFNRPEFDRYARFNSWGSARETFSWDDMCDMEISLPPVLIQQKYVGIYKSMVANQQAYESGLDDLKLLCDAYIEDLRRNISLEKVGKYIKNVKEINKDESVKNIVGLFGNTFRQPKGVSGQNDISRYQIIKKGYIVYPPPHFGEIGTIGLYNNCESALVSPMYVALKSADDSKLLPEYLIMWFQREEFKRYAFFASCSSIRDTFDYNLLCEYEIPIPEISIQQSIVNIYNAYIMRKDINDKLKTQIKDICPILIKGSLEEAQL